MLNYQRVNPRKNMENLDEKLGVETGCCGKNG
jgi:hypothetical protein